MDLLFTFAHWHGLAKLRMHTDATLTVLDEETTVLANQLRSFQSETCSACNAYELKREVAARVRRDGKKENGLSAIKSQERRPKTLNLQTYKVHLMGATVP
jgi:hypothetical protein